MKAVKNTMWAGQTVPNDVSLNRLISRAIERGKINPIPKAHEPIRVKVTKSK